MKAGLERIEELGNQIEEAQELIAETLDALPIGVVVVGSDGDVKVWNRVARELVHGQATKLRPGECILQFQGQSESRNDPAPSSELPLVRALTKREPVYDYRARFGSREVSVTSCPLSSGAFCVVTEIHGL